MHGANINKNKPVRYVALVGFACGYWIVGKSSYADPVKPATCINNHRLQCLLGGLRSDVCKPYNRRDLLDAEGCASASA